MKLTFTIPGRPRPWKRAGSNNGRRFTSRPDEENRARIREEAHVALARPELDGWPVDARFTLTLYITHDTRRACDLDNFSKVVGDALNGVVWSDDAQIDELRVVRCTPSKEAPELHIVVEVREATTDVSAIQEPTKARARARTQPIRNRNRVAGEMPL